MYEFVGERDLPEVSDRDAHHRIQVLERDGAVVRSDERVQRLEVGCRRPGVSDAVEVGGEVCHVHILRPQRQLRSTLRTDS